MDVMRSEFLKFIMKKVKDKDKKVDYRPSK